MITPSAEYTPAQRTLLEVLNANGIVTPGFNVHNGARVMVYAPAFVAIRNRHRAELEVVNGPGGLPALAYRKNNEELPMTTPTTCPVCTQPLDIGAEALEALPGGAGMVHLRCKTARPYRTHVLTCEQCQAVDAPKRQRIAVETGHVPKDGLTRCSDGVQALRDEIHYTGSSYWRAHYFLKHGPDTTPAIPKNGFAYSTTGVQTGRTPTGGLNQAATPKPAFTPEQVRESRNAHLLDMLTKPQARSRLYAASPLYHATVQAVRQSLAVGADPIGPLVQGLEAACTTAEDLTASRTDKARREPPPPILAPKSPLALFPPVPVEVVQVDGRDHAHRIPDNPRGGYTVPPDPDPETLRAVLRWCTAHGICVDYSPTSPLGDGSFSISHV